MSTTLVIISESWPLGGFTEPSFIEPEIDALVSCFDKIIVAPSTSRGKQALIPKSVTLDTSLVGKITIFDKIRAIFSTETWKHLFADRSQIRSFASFRASIAYSAYVITYRKRLLSLIKKHKLNLPSTLFYSFWFDFQTPAICSIPDTKVICRAHGHDAYYPPGAYFCRTWREQALHHMLACYPVSAHIASHIRDCHPAHAAKIKCRLLGTMPPTSLNPPPESATISIVSIARVAPEKRVTLIYESLRHWAVTQPGINLNWVHIGNGPLMPELKKRIADVPANLSISLRGALNNREVHHILSSEHFDFCTLLSSSEGLGLALCEALSHGIPIIATGVGGMPEVCTPDVGIILSANPTPQEFVEKATSILTSLSQMRRAARKKWERCYNAESLRSDFANEIRALP